MIRLFWDREGNCNYALLLEETEANKSFAFALSITGLTTLVDYFEDFEKIIRRCFSYQLQKRFHQVVPGGNWLS